MKKRTELDWKELGRFVSMIVDLFATIRDTFKEKGIGIEIIPWLLGRGKEEFISVLNDLGERFLSFFTPLSDEGAVNALVEAGKYDKARATAIVTAWRRLADEHGYNGQIAQRVKAGFTLKDHALKAGPCHKSFDHLRGWELRDDEPTKESIIFFIPRLVANSRNKNIKEQMTLLSDLRQRFNLPAHHLSSFGFIALLVGLIFAHFKRVGERIPLEGAWTHTDTFSFNCDHLFLGPFDESGLGWHWGSGNSGSNIGCFALGVEVLGS